MTDLIDNSRLFEDAHRIIGAADLLVERLERDVVIDSPEKAKTMAAIKFILNTQSDAIRKLVEHQAQICDQLNLLIPHLPE